MYQKQIATLWFLLVFGFTGAQTNWHVTVDGSPSGEGSIQSPWDIVTGLDNPDGVLPGDTIFIHEGVYRGFFVVEQYGEEAAPVVIMPYDREIVVLEGTGSTSEGNVIYIEESNFVTIRDLIVRGEPQNRMPRNPYDIGGIYAAGTGVSDRGFGYKIINCIVHDISGVGMGLWKNASDLEASGNIVFNVGSMGEDRGEGHCAYIQNTGSRGSKLIKNNVFFSAFHMGMNIYGSSNSLLQDVTVENNIVFNAGMPTGQGTQQRNINCYGGRTIIDDLVIDGNITYFRGDMSSGPGILVGQFNPNDNFQLVNNYVFGGSAGIDIRWWDFGIINNNIVVPHGGDFPMQIAFPNGDLSNWSSNNNYFYYPEDGRFRSYDESTLVTTFYTWDQYQSAFPTLTSNCTFSTVKPNTNVLKVFPNEHEPGRAHIAVINHEGLNSVSVDLSEVLNSESAFYIYDVENLFGAPVAQGVYSGAEIELPVNQTVYAQMSGIVPDPNLPHTPVEFGAYLLLGRPLNGITTSINLQTRKEENLKLISCYPNPTIDNVTAECFCKYQGKISVQIINGAGKVINTEQHNVEAESKNQIQLSLPQGAGIYKIRISNGTSSVVESVVKKR
nr:T9SS type A sorting domain-containing protein [Bacteroidota bacterium]